jgi:glycosyltransferase involved in cell wall biosynthesis
MAFTWTVAQIGARESYAAGRAFAKCGRLHRLYTDAWCRFGAGILSRGPSFTRALAGRRHPDLPDDRVVSFTPTAVLGEVRARLPPAATPSAVYDEYLRVGRWFDRRVARHMARHPLPAGPNAFFTYNTGCLETLRLLRDRGVVTIVDQIDPARVEYEIVRAEAARWPDWAVEPPEIPGAYFDRLAAEWSAADAVVVNSAWSADALVRQGVPREKLHIVPLAYDPPPAPPARPPRPAGEPLVVLWLGTVVLRKGIQYLVEAARRLIDRPIRFVIVGPIDVAPKAVAAAPRNVEFVGRITRDRTAVAYQSADLFVLPTLSDGFALTQLEAMAHGLPVVATPNCGTVVEPGRDGLIVPAGDAGALADAIASFEANREWLVDMSHQALGKVQQFSLRRFSDGLEAVAEKVSLSRVMQES